MNRHSSLELPVRVRPCPSVSVHVRGVSGQWGQFSLRPIALDVAAGEYLVVLGPSGCGKTTLLELICGLRQPSSGRIALDDLDITYADPADRRTGYVPQDYLLFPGRTAEWNLKFPATVRRVARDDCRNTFETIVDTLQLAPVLRQPVETLSGGERQRVALGRALMAEPDVLLLDEPVSALPENLRDSVCREIRRIQRELGITAIHVSHNLDEALAVADRIVVMDVGSVAQAGTVEEILDRPASRFVAEFTRARNIWPAQVKGGILACGSQPLGSTDKPDGAYYAVIRPEYLRLFDTAQEDAFSARVIESTRTEHGVLTRVAAGSMEICVCDGQLRTADTAVYTSIPVDHLHLIPEN